MAAELYETSFYELNPVAFGVGLSGPYIPVGGAFHSGRCSLLLPALTCTRARLTRRDGQWAHYAHHTTGVSPPLCRTVGNTLMCLSRSDLTCHAHGQTLRAGLSRRSCHRNSIKTLLCVYTVLGSNHLNSDKPFWTRRYYGHAAPCP